MAEKATRNDPFGLDGKVVIVTGGGAVDDGIGNGRAAAILEIGLTTLCRKMKQYGLD